MNCKWSRRRIEGAVAIAVVVALAGGDRRKEPQETSNWQLELQSRDTQSVHHPQGLFMIEVKGP